MNHKRHQHWVYTSNFKVLHKLESLTVNAERMTVSEAYEKGIVSEEGQARLHILVESYRKGCKVSVFGYICFVFKPLNLLESW